MRKPKRLSAADLAHPNATHYKAANGDIRPKPNNRRFNHASDLEDTGTFSRRAEQGLTVTHGKQPPAQLNFKQGKLKAIPPKELDKSSKGVIQPIPEGHTFTPAMQHDTQPLKDNGPQVFAIGGQTYSPYSKPSKAQLRELNAPVAKPKTARQKRQTHSS